MRKKLISLLAAAVLCKFAMPAAAQDPEVGVDGLPWGNPAMSAKAGPWCDGIDSFAPALWFTCSSDALDLSKLAAMQGPIARALGLPAPAAQERCDAAKVPDVSGGRDKKPGVCSSCFVDPFHLLDSVGPGAGIFDLCQHVECYLGNVAGLASPASEYMMVAGCDMPACATNFDCETCPGLPIQRWRQRQFCDGFLLWPGWTSKPEPGRRLLHLARLYHPERPGNSGLLQRFRQPAVHRPKKVGPCDGMRKPRFFRGLRQ